MKRLKINMSQCARDAFRRAIKRRKRELRKIEKERAGIQVQPVPEAPGTSGVLSNHGSAAAPEENKPANHTGD